MGNLCSKTGTTTSEDAVLRPSAASPAARRSYTNGAGRLGIGGRGKGQGHVLGGEASAPRADDPRAAAAQAAEERLKSSQKRGVVNSNPKSGKLAAQLEANKGAPRVPEQRQEERLVWD